MSTQKVTDQEIQAALEQLAQQGALGDLALQVLGLMMAEEQARTIEEEEMATNCGMAVAFHRQALNATELAFDLGLAVAHRAGLISDLGSAVVNHYVDALVQRLVSADEADGAGEISDIAIGLLEKAAGVSYTDDEAAMQKSTLSLSSEDVHDQARRMLSDAHAITNPDQWQWVATGIGLIVLGRIKAQEHEA